MTVRAGPRLGILAGMYLLLITIGAVASVVLLAKLDSAATHRRTMQIAAEQGARLQAAYADQEVAVRGYVMTGQEAFLEPWEQGDQDVERLRELLRAPAQFTPILEREWTALDAAARDWHVVAASAVSARRQDVIADGDIDVQMVERKRLFDLLRDRFDRFDRSLQSEVAIADARRQRAYRWAFSVVPTIFAVALALTAVSGWLVRRWLTKPLAAIVDATRQLQAGRPAEFPRGGLPDIREVIESVDSMQRTVIEQRDMAIRAREAMEQSAVLAIQLRSELAHELGTYPSGWTVAAGLLPATGIVAGDSYDVSLVNAHTMGVIVLDIAGHGATSAIAALKCKEMLKSGLRSGLQPGAALNFLMASDHGLNDSFLTAVVALLDTDTGMCRYANAGHPPPMIVSHHGSPTLLNPTGPLLGPIPASWYTDSVHVPNDSKFVIYTDGLIEARNAERTFFGEQTVIDLISGMECETVQGVIKNLFDHLAEFNEGRLADDVTLIVACRLDESEDCDQ